MEIMLRQLVTQWQKSVTVQVIGPFGNSLPPRKRGDRSDSGDIIRPARDGLLRFFGTAFFQAMRLLRRGDIDLIMTGSALITPIAVLLGILYRRPVVTQMHGLDLLYHHPVYQWAMRTFLPRCQLLFANSQHTKTLAVALGASADRIQVINPGLDFSEFSDLPDAERVRIGMNLEGHKLLLSAGRLAERKGIAEFVEHLLPELVKAHPNLLFLIVGENPTQSLMHKEDVMGRIVVAAKKANVADHVRLLGYVERPHLLNLFAASDLFVLPAIDIRGDVEGFGIVLIEASAARCPVVSTRLGGIPDAVADYDTGRLVDAGDWEAMATVIDHLLQDEALCQMMGENGRQRVREKFDWPIVGQRYLAFLNELVGK